MKKSKNTLNIFILFTFYNRVKNYSYLRKNVRVLRADKNCVKMIPLNVATG